MRSLDRHADRGDHLGPFLELGLEQLVHEADRAMDRLEADRAQARQHVGLLHDLVDQEVELADDMGVSRTPIREAIRKLEKEGLVSIEPRRGAYASDVSIKDMVDVLEVREFLEGMAAGLAAKKITEEEVERIRTATAAYKKAVESGNTEEIIKEDEIFHKLIVDCSGNKTLIQMINQIQELALRFRYIYYEDFSRYKNMPYEHQEIMDAIVSGDAEKAREKADSHVLRLKEFVVEQGDKIVKGQNA